MNKTDLMNALERSIRSEEEARNPAREARDTSGREMFERLASEEATHRKLLDHQYYALTNRGVWLWGD